MDVEDDGDEDGEKAVDEREDADREPADDDVAQESAEDAHVTRLEDGTLVEKDDAGVAETAADGRPRPCVESGDEEVVEVDADADDGRETDEQPPRIRDVDSEEDGTGDRERAEEMVFRVDRRSPATPTGGRGIKPSRPETGESTDGENLTADKRSVDSAMQTMKCDSVRMKL
jgi:hypothetical protein